MTGCADVGVIPVRDLRPGDVVRHPVRGLLATVVQAGAHPFYGGHVAVKVRLDGDGERVTQWILAAGTYVEGNGGAA